MSSLECYDSVRLQRAIGSIGAKFNLEPKYIIKHLIEQYISSCYERISCAVAILSNFGKVLGF